MRLPCLLGLIVDRRLTIAKLRRDLPHVLCALYPSLGGAGGAESQSALFRGGRGARKMLACCASKPEAADAKRPVGAAAEEGTPPPTAVSTERDGEATVSPNVPAAAEATDADGPSAEASSPSSVQNPKNKRMLAYMKQRSGDGEQGSPAADSAPLYCFFTASTSVYAPPVPVCPVSRAS